MGEKRSEPLFVKLYGESGLHIKSPEDSVFADNIRLTVYGQEARSRSERYVEVEFEVDRAQIINIAYSLWQYIDAEQKKITEMKARMRRE